MAVTADQYTTAAVFAGTFALVYLVVNRVSSRRQCGHLKLPPSVGSLPLIGSLPYLPGLSEMPMFFEKKAKELGDVQIVSFQVGSTYTVVLNTHEAIREAFVKRSTDFADRPTFYADKYFNPNNKGIVGHRYDLHFKKYHQLSLSILKEFGFGQNIMEERINGEVLQLINRFKEENGQPIEPKECVTYAVCSVISSIVFSHSLDQDKELSEASFDMIQKLTEGGFALVVLDIIPSLRFLPYFSKLISGGIAACKIFYDLIDKKIEENTKAPAAENFILSFLQHEGEGFDREQLHHTLRDLILAGTETSATTIRWALALLADHPDVQRRLQEEIDSVIPRDRLPSLDDKKKLPYVEAAILEIMRLKTLVPTGVPHKTLCDTEVRGYFIPSGSMVISNLYAAHMDPKIWDRPKEFRPERFLDSAGNVINRDMMISFSVGKRSCLGELLARQEVFLFIAGLAQQFHIRPPEGVERIDAKDDLKATLAPTPFEVRLIARD